jgi:hypothetical protein
MLNSQPFFINGIDDPTEARDNAFGAFVMFITTFIMSAIGMWYDSNIKQDQMETSGESETEYQLAGEFPNYGTN